MWFLALVGCCFLWVAPQEVVWILYNFLTKVVNLPECGAQTAFFFSFSLFFRPARGGNAAAGNDFRPVLSWLTTVTPTAVFGATGRISTVAKIFIIFIYVGLALLNRIRSWEYRSGDRLRNLFSKSATKLFFFLELTKFSYHFFQKLVNNL